MTSTELAGLILAYMFIGLVCAIKNFTNTNMLTNNTFVFFVLMLIAWPILGSYIIFTNYLQIRRNYDQGKNAPHGEV